MTTPGNPRSDRIIQLDALRGLAVIGIVWMNVYVFALPAQGYYNPIAWSGAQVGEGAPFDRLVWTASFLFIEDKFRPLFAMLFVIERAQQSGKGRVWRAHFARMAVLLVIGLIHAVSLANNDILRGYALAGCALPLLAHLPARALVAIAVGLVVVHLGGGIVTFGGAIHDWARGYLTTDRAMFAERNFGTDEWAVRFSLDQLREPLLDRIERRMAGFSTQMTTILAAMPINLAAMVLGMAFWKSGMFTGEWRTFRLQRLAAVCALFAIPPLLGLALWVGEAGFPGAYIGLASLIASAPFDTALGVAYAALAMAFFTSGGAVTRRLASVGRLSLTNYLMTSVILAAIFASWGMGLAGTVSRTQAFALSFVPIAAMLVWSPLWTAKVGQGPFERLWRGLARLLS